MYMTGKSVQKSLQTPISLSNLLHHPNDLDDSSQTAG